MFVNKFGSFENLKFCTGKKASVKKMSSVLPKEDMELAQRIFSEYNYIVAKARRNMIAKTINEELGVNSEALSATLYQKIYRKPSGGSKTIAVG